MRLLSSTAALAGGVAVLFLSPASAARGQEKTIVSSHVEVSARAASLRLELADGERMEIAFSDGVVRANGRAVGRYEPNGAADQAWRRLLSAAMSMSAEPLAQELARWNPGEGLPAVEREVLDEVDRVLDEAVANGAPVPAGNRNRFRTGDQERARAFLRFFAHRAPELGMALEDVDVESMELVLGEDRTVSRNSSVDGSVFLADGTLEVRGRIRGHAIVVDGTAVLDEGGRVDGDVRLWDADIVRRGGTVRGEVVDVLRESDGAPTADAHPGEHIQWGAARDRWEGRRSSGVLSRVGRAAGGVLEAGVSFLVLAFLTLLSTRLAGDRVDAVAQAVQQSPARSAAVGLASGFLILPLYVLGAAVLAITIVGIPVLLAWVPLYPVAVAAAGAVGYVAASHQVGRWVANQKISKLEWVDRRNPTHLKLLGVAALTVPFAVAALASAMPVVGWIGGIVRALGALGCVAAAVTGLGAVIITRGGRYPAADYAFADTLDSEPWSEAAGEDES